MLPERGGKKKKRTRLEGPSDGKKINNREKARRQLLPKINAESNAQMDGNFSSRERGGKKKG